MDLNECSNLLTNPEVCNIDLEESKIFCGEGYTILNEVDFNNCCGENHCGGFPLYLLLIIIFGGGMYIKN